MTNNRSVSTVADLISNRKKKLKMPVGVKVSGPCLDVISMLLQRQPSRRADAHKLSNAQWLREAAKEETFHFEAAGAAQDNASSSSLVPAAVPKVSNSDASSPIKSWPLLEAAGGDSGGGNGSASMSNDSPADESEWELVPSESTVIGEALLRQVEMRRTSLLKIEEGEEEESSCEEEGRSGGGGSGGSDVGEEVLARSDALFLKGIHEVMEDSRLAAEHLGAVNDPRVSVVLDQLKDFLSHPSVDKALARSVATHTAGGGGIF